MRSPLGAQGAAASSRLYPAWTQFDYIILSDLRASIAGVVDSIAGRILDYGCGQKPYQPLFTGCVSYEGADFPGNPCADWTLDERGHLPAQLRASFDAVVSFQVLEHVPNVPAYLEECRRVLRPDGHLLLTTHGIWEYHPGPHDVQRWTMEGLIRTIEPHGFEIIHCQAITTRVRSLLQQWQLLVRDSRIPGRRFAICALNLLAGWCRRSAAAADDRGSLAICYLFLGRKRTLPC
jgi:SAM-dependent methyltransferase